VKTPVAVLISGSGSNLQALMDACAKTDYPAQIVSVISNKEEAYGLTRAKAANIPTQVIRHKDYASREAFDEALHAAIIASGAKFVCLAGFMRVLTAGFVEKWQGRMINIHPSLLPSFKGMNTHTAALAAGVRIHGCSVHHVVPEMDSGPIILQAAVPVLAGDTPDTLGARVLAAEHVIYPAALAKVLAPSIALPHADAKTVLING
jgi:phosphoribosylglycinamide formyltransferase 1